MASLEVQPDLVVGSASRGPVTITWPNGATTGGTNGGTSTVSTGGADDYSAYNVIDGVYYAAIDAFTNAYNFAGTITGVSYNQTLYDLQRVPDIEVPAAIDFGEQNRTAPGVNNGTVGASSTPITPNTTISNFTQLPIPEFTDVLPEINFPDAVSIRDIDAPDSRPYVEDITLPETPEFELPELPQLANVVVPDDVNTVIPVFEFEFDSTKPFVPTNTFSFNEQHYDSTLLTAALELLEGDIKNGGYGLDPDEERNLWDRAKDRISQASEQERMEAEKNLASRGFTLPTGAHNALAARAAQNKTAKLSEVNKDIAIKRADQLVQARQFSVTTGLNAQQFLINLHNAMQERLLNANRYLAQFGLEYYEASVRDFQLDLERYKTEASVFESRLRAAATNLDIYRAKLEAARIKGQINQDYLDLYNAQFKGIEALTNIYNTQLQGTKVQAELQELQFRVYGEDIKAYVAQLDAEGQKVQNYSALVQAETEKVGAFNAKVNAHNALLDGVKVAADIESRSIEAEIAQAEISLKEHSANIETWAREYEQSLATSKHLLEKSGIEVDAWYKSQVLNNNDKELQMRSHGANVENLVKQRRFNLDKHKFEVDTYLKTFDGISNNIVKAGSIYSNLASSAYGAINTIAAVVD